MIMQPALDTSSRYDVREFRPSLYALVMLGITGFAFASESPAVWVLAAGSIAVHYWLTSTDRFKPIPRFIANIVTVGGVLLLIAMLQQNEGAPLLVIGHFLVLLQIVKFYEQRANRDYAQLLVLSLLLMVAAAISTASLLFGIILIGYLFLSLYCCLLFHLKVEADYARQILGLPEVDEHPAKIQEEQAEFAKSMRRVIAAISLAAVLSALMTFVLFPRGGGAGLFGPAQFRASQSLTGFSDSVSFQNVARITQNTQEIAKVTATRLDVPYQGILLLRGVTLDTYTGDGKAPGLPDRYQWLRTAGSNGRGISLSGARRGWISLHGDTPDAEIRQIITLSPTNTNALFAIGGIASFKAEDEAEYRYVGSDEVLQSAEVLNRKIRYEVMSSGELTSVPAAGDDYFQTIRSHIHPDVEPIARSLAVSGADEANRPLAPQRPKGEFVTDVDIAIARNIEKYLRDNFTYTLDLTDAAKVGDRDPLVAFLTDFKRGHCEYFAGAMALLCQSMDIRARVVVGFKCDEYNALGDYYTVRQSHAHAWVEVLSSEGKWVTFDPTTSNEEVTMRMDTLWQRLRAVFGYLEYQWEDAVIAYDQSRRTSVIGSVARQLSQAASRAWELAQSTWNWQGKVFLSLNLLTALVALMLLTLIGAISWYFWDRSQLRRRARRIGLDSLPLPEQLRLARQLQFYDEMIRLLERHGVVRPAHLTAMEFGGSLSYLPTEAFDAILRLTEVYYRVRYGRAEVSDQQRRHLAHAVASVEHAMATHYQGVCGELRFRNL